MGRPVRKSFPALHAGTGSIFFHTEILIWTFGGENSYKLDPLRTMQSPKYDE